MALLAGQDYPNSYAELRAWFNEDWKWLDYLDYLGYLDWLRWPEGFVWLWPVVPLAGGMAGSVRTVVGVARAATGGPRPPASTIFHGTRGLAPNQRAGRHLRD